MNKEEIKKLIKETEEKARQIRIKFCDIGGWETEESREEYHRLINVYTILEAKLEGYNLAIKKVVNKLKKYYKDMKDEHFEIVYESLKKDLEEELKK